jgi:hypothetical protein
LMTDRNLLNMYFITYGCQWNGFLSLSTSPLIYCRQDFVSATIRLSFVVDATDLRAWPFREVKRLNEQLTLCPRFRRMKSMSLQGEIKNSCNNRHCANKHRSIRCVNTNLSKRLQWELSLKAVHWSECSSLLAK